MENTSGAEPSSFTFSCIIEVENCKPHSVTGRLVAVEAKLWVPEGKEVLQRRALPVLPETTGPELLRIFYTAREGSLAENQRWPCSTPLSSSLCFSGLEPKAGIWPEELQEGHWSLLLPKGKSCICSSHGE